MKRFLFCCLLCLLLTACGKTEAPAATAPAGITTMPNAAAAASGPDLAGVWVNAGQYADGHDFVETLTLAEDGSVTVHLEYQGSDYATLTGVWSEADGVLSVDFADPNTKDRVYSYSLTQTALTLTGDGKDVTYIRKES